MSATQEQSSAPAQVEEVGFKVFCGNLSFATADAELQDVFGKIGSLFVVVSYSGLDEKLTR